MDFDRAKEAQRQRRLAVMLFVLIGSMVFVVWFTAIDLLSSPEPEQVAQDRAAQPAETAAPANQPNCEDPRSTHPQCIARREALVTWSQAEDITNSLMEKEVAVWAPEQITQTVEKFAQGVQAFNEGRFMDSAKILDDVLMELEGIETLGQQTLEDSLASGWRSFDGENSEEAVKSFELALLIDPDNQSAREGLARAVVLGEVLDLYYRGVAKESNNELQEAQALFEQASALDPKHDKVGSALSAIKLRIEETNYRQALSNGFSSLESNDGAGALQSFQSALAIRSSSSEARSGIERAQNMMKSQTLARLLNEAAHASETEDWEASSSLYGQALSIDPNAQSAIDGKEEIDELLKVESEVIDLIDRPYRLSSKAVFEYADEVLAEARSLAFGGTRLQVKADELDRIMADMQTPVPLLVQSDGRTNVSIQRIGDLGSFDQRVIDVLPGRYVLQGTRRGYRDVRLEIEISPGSQPTSITVVCNESF